MRTVRIYPGRDRIALTHGLCGGPIAVDSDGTLYETGTPLAVDPSNDDLYVAPGDGSISRSSNGGTAEPFATGVGNIASLAVDAATMIYVDEGDKVVELSSSGDEVGVPIGSGVVHNSSGVAVNSEGDVFVGNPGRSTVDEFGTTEPDPLPEIVSPVVADAVSSPSARHTADFQVSRDGGFAAFRRVSPSTGFESDNQQEVYRYDARPGSLACVSCNPTGVRRRATQPLHPTDSVLAMTAECSSPLSSRWSQAMATIVETFMSGSLRE